MRTYSAKLILEDGSTRTIGTGAGRVLRLTDRAFAHVNAVIQNRPLRRAPRLDAELGWLLSAVEIREPDGKTAFTELKEFAVVFFNRIERRLSALNDQQSMEEP
jgi:hypothetical protein